ncbi:MAG: MFS transporter [Chloroflexi bacterium]|nr:MAG: MFS transporter [Chloroflexota bacterium]
MPSQLSVYCIAAGAGIASMAMNFWLPLLPLYMQELGAGNQSSALFWTAIANIALGLARIVSGPLWGMVSDRIGRKPMFVRTLFCAAATIVIVAAAQAPWQVALAFIVQGLLSGFIPAATALMSVSVPEERMSASLSLVTGGQYLGTTLGPALGAALVVFFGFRGSMLVGAALPIVAALLVLTMVPRDAVTPRAPRAAGPRARTSPMAMVRTLPVQFYVAVFLFFLLFAMNQLVRLLTPLALQDIVGRSSVAAVSGLAFSISGAAAVLGIVFIGQRYVRPGRLKLTLIVGTIVAAAATAALAFAHVVPVFIALFTVFSLVLAMMIPATNTLIATNVSRERRGTGFGVASSAQAMALMVGPITAAAFGGALSLGFLVGGALFVGIAVLVFFSVREPRPFGGVVEAEAEAAS